MEDRMKFFNPLFYYTMRKITLREIEVLEYMANGYTMCEIATELFISVTTIITHKKNLITKFRARNTAHLIFLATREGLIDNQKIL